jgi:transcriptional adapter 3
METGSTSPNSASRKQKRNNSSRDLDSASSSLSPVQATPGAMDIDDKKDDGDGDSSSDEHQPKPAPAIPHMFTFGDDPSTFPDPTVYAIPLVLPGMSYEETCKIFSVSSFPKSDLSDLIPGFPPDKDFSNAKPTNQVQANTFATYLDPYFRPFNDEDLAFLRERGDRVAPFKLPRRGRKHYTEIWAEEDGIEYTSQNGRDKLPANQPRGNIEDMTDAVAETEQISLGPIASRLLSTLRHEQRATPPEINGLTNGESTTTGENGDLDNILGVTSDEPAPLPPATAMPDSNSEGWKKAIHPKLDALQVDERIKQELRHIGFLPDEPNAPEFDGHFDDELAARLRILQARYKEVAINNIARKLRLTELVKERMAHQEYSTILEDLDGQVQAHYLKRTRTMGKSKKAKRPGGAGGGSHVVAGAAGMAKPALNDQIKTAMDRRKKWTGSIGVVFDEKKPPNSEDPASFIFTPDQMAEHVSKAQEDWIEDADEE